MIDQDMTIPVRIAPYDTTWPAKFEVERDRLARVFSGVPFHIEHVGSTAVPNLDAKPIVDLMVGVDELRHIEARLGELHNEGYEYVADYEREMPDRRYFRKRRLGRVAYHLHCVVHNSGFWRSHIEFRDRLRSDPDVAARYLELKEELAAKHREDGRAYTEAKSTFINGVLRGASL